MIAEVGVSISGIPLEGAKHLLLGVEYTRGTLEVKTFLSRDLRHGSAGREVAPKDADMPGLFDGCVHGTDHVLSIGEPR
jgi:hypothetical protein